MKLDLSLTVVGPAEDYTPVDPTCYEPRQIIGATQLKPSPFPQFWSAFPFCAPPAQPAVNPTIVAVISAYLFF